MSKATTIHLSADATAEVHAHRDRLRQAVVEACLEERKTEIYWDALMEAESPNIKEVQRVSRHLDEWIQKRLAAADALLAALGTST